jgi:hypothetical protein
MPDIYILQIEGALQDEGFDSIIIQCDPTVHWVINPRHQRQFFEG